MKNLTIAEMREKDVYTLARRSANIEAVAMARKALNSFYRLAGFSNRLFDINNNERLYNRYKGSRLEAMKKRESEWIKRLNSYLKEFNCAVCFSGLYPSLVVYGEHGSVKETVIYGHFYN